MLLKRVYDHSAPREKWRKQYRGKDGRIVDDVKDAASERDIPPVLGVRILHAGPKQKFSPSFVAAGTEEGWLTITQSHLVIQGPEEQVTYRVERTPGHYCSYCRKPLVDAGAPGDSGETRGSEHVRVNHNAEGPSPDPANPNGYEYISYYDCTRLTPSESPKAEKNSWLATFKEMLRRG